MVKTIISQKANNVTASPTLAISAKAKEMKKSGIDVVGFGAGEPDFGTPENIKNAGIDAIKNNVTRYTPASGTIELKDAVVKKLKRDNGLTYDKSQVIIGCGAKHILYNIFQAICNKGDEVILFSPYWVSYPEMIKLAEGIPVVFETTQDNDFSPDIDKLKTLITDKTKAIIVNSPSNPTGAVYSKQTLQNIADLAIKKDILVISDEVYEMMVYGDNQHFSIAGFNDEIMKRTITVNAVSKTYAMTGWRIGYAAGPKEIIAAMGRMQSHSTSNPTSISQVSAKEALIGNQKNISTMIEAFAKRRDYVIDRCNKIKEFKLSPPQGAFYAFINISGAFGGKKGINNSMDFAKQLLEESHVAVVPGSPFGADQFIRVTFANSIEEISKGFDRIENFLSTN